MISGSTFRLTLLLIVLPNLYSFSQSTYTWRGANNGSWAVSTNWSPTRTTPASNDLMVFNTGTTLTISAVPTQAIGSLTISNNSNITFNGTGGTLTIGDQTGDDIVIVVSSSLTLGTSGNITLANNATSNIGGTLTINAGRTYNTNGTTVVTTVAGSIINLGTVTSTTATNLVFSSGSKYQHSQNGGAIPTATWNLSSTCLITGTTTTIPTNTGQSFGNFTWNCTSQTAASTPAAVYNIQGNLTVQSTGTAAGPGQFRMGNGTNNVLGNYSQTDGTVRIGSNTARTLIVGGNLSLTGGTLLMSSGTAVGTLNVAGNFSHTAGTITETGTGSGNIVFNGIGNQTYTGGGTLSNTINFTLNNAAGLTLNSSVSFPAALTLTIGNITTGSNVLTLGTDISNRGSLTRTSGTIIGNFKRWFATSTISNVLFPIGTMSKYRPANISFTSAIAVAGSLTAAFIPVDPGSAGLPLNDGGTSIVNVGAEGYWSINSGDGLSGGIYSLDLTADGFNGVTNVSTLRLIKRATDGNWILQGSNSPGTGTTSTPVVHRTGMSGFSEFGVGGANDNPLPVELSSFSAIIKNGEVILKWRTDTEVNNYGFEVHKSEINSPKSEWTQIGFVQGNGNSNSPKEYSFIDEKVKTGKYSYRLKQIDTDGNFEYSKIIEVNIELPAEYELSQNYPNPFNPSTTIRFTIPEPGNVKLIVYNIIGEQIYELMNEYKEAGGHTISFNASGLNSGIYIYKLESNGHVETKKK
jgi:hypothetical protein